MTEPRGVLRRRVTRLGPGGLVTGLKQVVPPETIWVAHAMNAEDTRLTRKARSPRVDLTVDGRRYAMHFVGLPEAVAAGWSNFSDLLWLIMHDLPITDGLPVSDQPIQSLFEHSQEAQRRFASAVLEEISGIRDRAPLVWVHDYQLMMLAGMIKRARPDARVAYFHHTPWAGLDAWSALPDAISAEIWANFLEANLIGVHTNQWTGKIAEWARQLGFPVETSQLGDREGYRIATTTLVGAYPLGIDAEEARTKAANADLGLLRGLPITNDPDCRILGGVDRSDFKNGVPDKIEAFRLRFEQDLYLRKVQLLQQVIPTRQSRQPYREELARTRAAAARLNEDFRQPGWQPVVLIPREDRALAYAIYKRADALMVAAKKDGMNLVSHEFGLSQEEFLLSPEEFGLSEELTVRRKRRGGVLVLSIHAGAAAVLGSAAIPLDPQSPETIALALDRAITIGPDEQARMAREAHAILGGFEPWAWARAQWRDARGDWR